MIDSLVNSIAGDIFSNERSTHPSMCMPHDQMVAHAYGYHKREWVELTKGEILSWDLPSNMSIVDLAWFIESKIREKNQ